MWMIFASNSYNNDNDTWYFLLFSVVFVAVPTVFILVRLVHIRLLGKTEHRLVTCFANKKDSVYGEQSYFFYSNRNKEYLPQVCHSKEFLSILSCI